MLPSLPDTITNALFIVLTLLRWLPRIRPLLLLLRIQLLLLRLPLSVPTPLLLSRTRRVLGRNSGVSAFRCPTLAPLLQSIDIVLTIWGFRRQMSGERPQNRCLSVPSRSSEIPLQARHQPQFEARRRIHPQREKRQNQQATLQAEVAGQEGC